MEKLCNRIESGQGTMNDVQVLASVGHNIMGNTICAFGDGAAMPMVGFVQKFRDDFEKHVLLKRCPLGNAA
jgi:NADH-quinone oxidoreductase subunit F